MRALYQYYVYLHYWFLNFKNTDFEYSTPTYKLKKHFFSGPVSASSSSSIYPLDPLHCLFHILSSTAFNGIIKKNNEDRKRRENRDGEGRLRRRSGVEVKSERGSGGCPKADTSRTANPTEHHSISLESFCFKVKSVTKEPNSNSSSSKHCSVPIYGPNPSSEGQAWKDTHTHFCFHSDFIKVSPHEQLSSVYSALFEPLMLSLLSLPHTLIHTHSQ